MKEIKEKGGRGEFGGSTGASQAVVIIFGFAHSEMEGMKWFLDKK